MSSVISPADINNLGRLQVILAESLDYELESGDVAVLKAKRVMLAARILRARRPVSLSQGGYGKGSGFAQEYDQAALKEFETKAKAWLIDAGVIAGGVMAGVFGFFEADGREFSEPFEAEVVR